jgi:septum formation protein
MAERLRPQLILASASPRRKMLLRKLGVAYTVRPSHVLEDSIQKNPKRLVEELALRKALATAALSKSGWVLGADTVVVLGRKILGKPLDMKDAYRMLYRLSNSTHQVYTGVALVEVGGERQWVSHAVSHVRMKKMPIDQILKLSQKHLDKAGAYAIQDRKDPYATLVKGTYENVVGLPLDVTAKLLRKAGLLP